MGEYAKENYLLALASGTSEACLSLAEIAIVEKDFLRGLHEK